MKAVVGSLKRFWERFKEENTYLQVSVPIVGITTNIPLTERGKVKPTSIGVQSNDAQQSFIEDDVERLLKFYTKYETSKEYKFSRSPYAETIPLRKGNRGFPYGKNVDDLQLINLGYSFSLPDYLLQHREKAIDVFKSLGKIKYDELASTWQNDYSIRVAKIDLSENKIYIQPATYFDQIGSNLTLDWASGVLGDDDLLTIRNSVEKHEDGLLPSLSSSILANTLGVAAIIINRTSQEMLIPIRGNEQAVMSKGLGKFHCSASGGFSWSPDDIRGNAIPFDFFTEGMAKEIESEIGLKPDQYDLIPVALTRELVRGGKPQLFFIAETDIDISQIQMNMKNAEESWEFIDENDIEETNPLHKFISTPLDAPQEMFTYEGWMALKIAVAYFYNAEPPFSAC